MRDARRPRAAQLRRQAGDRLVEIQVGAAAVQQIEQVFAKRSYLVPSHFNLPFGPCVARGYSIILCSSALSRGRGRSLAEWILHRTRATSKIKVSVVLQRISACYNPTARETTSIFKPRQHPRLLESRKVKMAVRQAPNGPLNSKRLDPMALHDLKVMTAETAFLDWAACQADPTSGVFLTDRFLKCVLKRS